MNATALLHAAAGTGRDFLVIGGLAVNAHGYPRSTYDVDLMIPETDRVSWREVIENLGYRCFHEVPAFAQFSPPPGNQAPLDLMIVLPETFAKMWNERIYRAVGGVDLPFPKAEHVVAMKLFSARSPTRRDAEKDWWDLLKVIELCKLDVQAAAFRSMVQKYGSPDAYTRITRHFRALPRG